MIELYDPRGGNVPKLSTQVLRAFAQTMGTEEEPPDPLAFFRSPQQPF